jgi:hypothetical protein
MITAVWQKMAQQRVAIWLLPCLCTAVLFSATARAADAAGKSVPAKPATEMSPDLLNYMLSTGALSVDDAQKLVDHLKAEEAKKRSEGLLNYLLENKMMTLQDAQKLLNDLRESKNGKAVAKPAAAPPAAAPIAAVAADVAGTPAAMAATAPADAAQPQPMQTQAAPTAAPLAVVPAATAAKPAEADKAPANRVHAVYLPDAERARIRDEIKQDILATARKENWAQPDAVPEWVHRLRFSGDILVRGEGDFLDHGNDPAINFQAANAGSPVDIFPPTTTDVSKPTVPFLNTTEDRAALRLRVRLSLQADVADKVDAGLRLATGNTGTPVSTTQTLGNDFNKLSFVLDRAWLRYRTGSSLGMTAGRMPSPWLAPTDLVWDKDLGFDGLAMQFKNAAGKGVNTFATVGAFAIASTDGNFPSLSPAKVSSRDKWLLGVQIGGDVQTAMGFGVRSSVALYDFRNIEGARSSQCYAPTDKAPCDTDNSRPGFSQKGNTMFALRNLYKLKPATDEEFQYFGLASPFRVLSAGISIDKPLHDAVHAQFDLEAARNLEFNPGHIAARVPVNNFATCPAAEPNCALVWVGGGDAWQSQLRLGYAKVSEYGDWNSVFGYRYVETDAVVDAFTDSDFHLGGTNAKGFYIGGNIGVAHNTWLGLKYMSASEVSGWKYSVDVLQLDLNARF